MLRLVLVNQVNRPQELNEPLGTGVLEAAVSNRFGDQVIIHNVLVDSRDRQDQLEDELLAWQPDVIGVSSKIGELDALLDLYRFVTRELSDAVFVVGDQLATLGSESLLDLAPEAICVRGEGEEALVGILEVVARDRTALRSEIVARDVPNCVLRLDGEARATTARAVGDLGTLPPCRPFLDRAVSDGWIIHAEASRGCPWGRCTFCYIQQKYHGRGSWRPIPIDRVLDDLEALDRAGARTVFFTDEDFVGPDWDRIHALANAIIDAKASGRLDPNQTYFVSSGVRTLIDLETEHGDVVSLLALLRRAGVQELFLGIESGCQAQLDRYKKGISVDENLTAVRWLREAGIELDLGFLPFDPWTDLHELAENLDFIRRAGLIHHPVRIFKRLLLTPKTALANRWNRQSPGSRFCPNALSLEYGFSDPRVAEIARLVEARWEVRKDALYRAQAARRIQLGDDVGTRDGFTSLLNRERADDYCFVARCVTEILADPDNWARVLERVRATDRVLGSGLTFHGREATERVGG